MGFRLGFRSGGVCHAAPYYTVEFVNLVLQAKLTSDEKIDLVAFTWTLS
jgi:hypothetical protein